MSLKILKLLIRELRSPVGDSEAELLTDIDEVLEVLNGIMLDAPPQIRMDIQGLQNGLRAASLRDGRAISSALAMILEYIDDNDLIDAPGLILRLETLIRRSLPTSGNYDTPQSGLNLPYDPTKTGRYMTVEKM